MNNKKTNIKNIDEEKNMSLDKDFLNKISEIISGLFYISETDAEINLYIGKKMIDNNPKNFLKQLNVSESKKIAEIDFESFFRPLINFKNWSDSENIEMSLRFYLLKKILQDNLIELKVYKIGKINLDVYVVGLDSEGKLVGVQTKAVET